MRIKPVITSCILGSVILLSCKKGADKPSPANVSYQFKLGTTRSSPVARMQSSSIDWTSGYANVSKIEFEAEGECQIEGQSDIHKKFETGVPQKIDLFAPLSRLGNLPVLPCTYSNPKFEIVLAPTTGTAAFELKGMYNSTPVTFTVNTPLELDIKGNNTSITSGASYAATTTMNLLLLTQGITTVALDAATKDASGTIVISSSSNKSLYDVILNNFDKVEDVDFH